MNWESQVTEYNPHNNHLSDVRHHQQVNRIRQGRFGFNFWAELLDNNVLTNGIYEENLNTQHCVVFWKQKYSTLLTTYPITWCIFYFLHKVAPPHNAYLLNEYINANFWQQWIGNSRPIRWAVRSPDLTPIDSFQIKMYSTKNTLSKNLEMSLRPPCEMSVISISKVLLICGRYI